MAPEQQRGDTATVTPAADVYSLGALLQWMLGGTKAPKRLRAIALKCLHPAPEDRYRDAAALVADLGRYRAGQPVDAHPESFLERGWRWAEKYRTFILLILAYLIMRAAFAYFSRR